MAIFWRYEGTVGPRERKVGAKLHSELKRRMELGGLTRSGHRKKIDGVQYEVLSHGYTDEIHVDTTGVFDFIPDPIEADIPEPPEHYRPEPAEEFEDVETEVPEPQIEVPEIPIVVEEEEEEDTGGGGDGRSLMCIFYNEIDAIGAITGGNFWASFVAIEDQEACRVLANNKGLDWESRMQTDLPNIRTVLTNGAGQSFLTAITSIIEAYPGYTDVYLFHNASDMAIYSTFTSFDLLNRYVTALDEGNIKRAIYNDRFGYIEGLYGYAGNTGADTIGPLLESRGIYWDEYFGGSTYNIDTDSHTSVSFGALGSNLSRGLDDMYNQALAFAKEHGLI